jgi:hypothetical protein
MTLPSVPDNLYKLFTLAGIFCLAYGYIQDNENCDKYFSKVATFDSAIDSLNIQVIRLDHQKNRLYKLAKELSQKNGVSNPITTNDSLIVFSRIVKGNNSEVFVSDTLARLWDEYIEADFNLTLYNKQLGNRKEGLKYAKEEYDAGKEETTWIFLCAAVSLIIGVPGLVYLQVLQDELLKRQLLDKPKPYKYCQSCGKKFSSIRKPAKDSDGTLHTAFCKDCFIDGRFVEPNLSIDEFNKRINQELRKRKTWVGRKMLSKRLRNLERWDNDEYF